MVTKQTNKVSFLCECKELKLNISQEAFYKLKGSIVAISCISMELLVVPFLHFFLYTWKGNLLHSTNYLSKKNLRLRLGTTVKFSFDDEKMKVHMYYSG